MLFQRSAITLARRIAVRPAVRPIINRTFVASAVRREANITPPTLPAGTKKLEEIRSEDDLLAPGAAPGTIPTDAEQSTGLERLEILGKMQGVDIFDMTPLDSSRKGTMDNPIMVRSAGDEQYCGCTGVPADTHVVRWLVLSRDRPIERCDECGNVLKMEYVGPEEDPHAHDHGHGDHHHADAKSFEPKSFADYVKPEYLYK